MSEPSGPHSPPQPVPSPTPWSSPPQQPMSPASPGGGGGRGGRGWFVGLAAVVVLAVGGVAAFVLESEDDGGGSAVASSELELEDLRPALLTEEDLGDGWTSEGADQNVGLPDEWDISDECRRAAAELGMDPSEDVPSVQDNFRQGPEDESPTLMHDLSLVEADTPSLAATGQAMDDCGEMSYDDGEWFTTMQLHPQEADGPGDEALAFEIELNLAYHGGIDIDGVVLHGYGLLTRRSGVESAVSYFGGFDEDVDLDEGMVEGDEPDVDLVHDLAEIADRKLADLAG